MVPVVEVEFPVEFPSVETTFAECSEKAKVPSTIVKVRRSECSTIIPNHDDVQYTFRRKS